MQRVRDILAGCRFVYPGDLTADAPAKVARYLHGRVGKPRAVGGLSHQTAAFFLAAARRFAWWLSARGNAPVKPTPFDDVPGFEPTNHRVHARRRVPPEELAKVLEAARAGKPHRGLSGADRYALYLVAFGTGLRVGELAALTTAHFDLDAATVARPGRRTKNRKAARLPLPPGVAAHLRGYLASRPPAAPVWPGTWAEKPVKMLRRDLKAAGVPYAVETPDGPRYADFHALRHSFLSALAAAGVGVKELQELARHSDPRLTLGVYTHAGQEQLAAAAARLPLPTGDDGNPFARMTRAELEAALAFTVAVLNTLFYPSGVNRGVNESKLSG